MHQKEKLILDWIKKIKIERESQYLGYRLKYGIYKNLTLHDVFQTKKGIMYILWLKNHTKNNHFKQILTKAGKEELKVRRLEFQRDFASIS